MKPVLLLIDLQLDFLNSAGLSPAAGQLVERAEVLLQVCRQRKIPVVHVWTTVRRDDDRRMPHLKAADRWLCEAETVGHETPPALRPLPSEIVFEKTTFSAFEDDRFDASLIPLDCNTLVVAGVHLHSCVRATVLDAYKRGFAMIVAADAVGSDDPMHDAVTRRYLADRCARFESVESLSRILAGESRDAITHYCPRDTGRALWQVPLDNADVIATATEAAASAQVSWRDRNQRCRAEVLRNIAQKVEEQQAQLAEQMADEIGKPMTQSRAEVRFGLELLGHTAQRAQEPIEYPIASAMRFRYRPLGVVGIVTPYNNPLSIPLGKIAPALLWGNAVAWKPAPAGTGVARRLMRIFTHAGVPEGLINLITGDQHSARLLAQDPRINAVTLSGSPAAGWALLDACTRRSIRYQAELGGNNAAIAWDCSDSVAACSAIVNAAFGFAGQRCTANRRMIVPRFCYEMMVDLVGSTTAELVWSDPLEPETQAGPVISTAKRAQIAALVDRAQESGCRVLKPHLGNDSTPPDTGAYYPPTVVCCDDPVHEIAQEESFGPVLVIQPADDFEHAMQLCNGVRQGLIAAIFTDNPELKTQFLNEAQAGVVKINTATADADPAMPFGGWKASGIGPGEHGPADREFYTQTQAVYE